MVDSVPTLKFQQYNSDLPVDELPDNTLSVVENVEFVDGQYCQARPYAPVFGTLSGAPRWLLPNQTAAKAFWIYATNTAFFVTDGVTHFDISPAGLTDNILQGAPYTGGIINQRPVINSLVDGPYWWDQITANIVTGLPDWPAGDLCNSMRPFREFLIAMNIFTGGERIPDLLRFSDAAAPGDIPRSWTPGTGSQAGERSVSFNPGGLVDGRQLIDRFYMYKASSCYLLQLIGGQFIFSSRPVFSTVGALARNCIEEYRGKHIVLTDGDLIEHDGVTVNSLVSEQQRKRIFDELDGTNFENSYLYLTKSQGELGIARPRTGETYPSEVLTFNLSSKRFGDRSLPAATPYVVEGLVDAGGAGAERTWNAKTTTWATDPTKWNSGAFVRTADFVLMADFGASKVQQIGEGADFDGAPIAAKMERTGLAFGNENVRKLGVTSWLSVAGAIGGALQVELGYHDLPDSPVTWAPAQNWIIGTTRFLNFDVQGYYLAYRITSSAQLSWHATKLKLGITELGPY